jgi:hypothetical protein
MYTDDAGRPWYDKDPNDTVEVGQVWADWLGELGEAETLQGVAWTATTGLTVSGGAVNAEARVIDGVTYPIGTVALITLSGGSVGNTYRVTCRATTTLGNIVDRSFWVRVVER